MLRAFKKMNLNQIHNVYFIGIGGIGMSALARYFQNVGKKVSGYDKTPTTLTDELIADGMDIHFEDNINLIPTDFYCENTLVIVTPAVPVTHSEWNYFVERDYNIKKRAEVLGIITKDTFCFAVAGTHGKTTTSSILGHILYESGADVTAFLGGIVENYHSNLIGTGKTVTVVEADEFDRSFLHLHPNIACVTSMDADHLDIYGDKAAIEDSFREFADKVQDKGNLFVPKGMDLHGVSIAINEEASFKAHNIRIENSSYVFDVQTPTETISNIVFGLPGHHNLMNALMALAMAKTYGTSSDAIKNALATFKGVQRRFSYQIKTDSLVYIDDYAHHPTEINAVHQAVRELYPNQKVLAVFQPHLFSRTKDFVDDFAKSLSQFDEVLMLDIYPARELPIPGITSSWLLEKMNNKNKKLVSKEKLIEAILESDAKVIVTIGAGDIGELVPSIKKMLLFNNNPMVDKAEVYVTVDGVLKAIVKQKAPIARVFDSVGTYYLDNEGNTMPLSGLNTARVPLVLGEISSKNRKKLAQVLRVINKDPFLKKNIIGVELDANDDLKMTNRNFDFQIEFGKMVQVENKFYNYKAFFQKAIIDSSLTKYKKINLRFSHQVVCTK